MLTAPPSQPPTAPPKRTGPPDDGDGADKDVIEMVQAMGDALVRVLGGERTLISRGPDAEAFIGVIPMAGIPREIALQAIERWHQWVLDYRPGDEFDPAEVV